MKEEVKQLREEIAALEKEQINMKAQRKTVNLKVERTVNPFEAADTIEVN
jgi:ribosomal protein L29